MILCLRGQRPLRPVALPAPEATWHASPSPREPHGGRLPGTCRLRMGPLFLTLLSLSHPVGLCRTEW